MARPRPPRPTHAPVGVIPTSTTHVSSSQVDNDSQDVRSQRLPSPPTISEDQAAADLGRSVEVDDGAAEIPIQRPRHSSQGFDTDRIWELHVVNGKRLEPSNVVSRWITEITQA